MTDGYKPSSEGNFFPVPAGTPFPRSYVMLNHEEVAPALNKAQYPLPTGGVGIK